MADPSDAPDRNGPSSNAPGTNARTEAEGQIETLRQRGGIFVNAGSATRMPMALTDPNLPGNPIVFANEAFVKLTGYSMNEILGQQPHFMNGRETDPKDAARFAEAVRSDQDDIIETVQYRKDGSRFVAAVLLSAYKDDQGRTLNHFMSWLDVTRRVDAEDEIAELRATETALRENEEQLRLIVESARDYAIFVTDPDGIITTWLPGAENVFGWTKAEAEGQPIDITFTPEDRAQNQPRQEIETAMRDGKAPDVRWHIRKDGRRVFIDGQTIALRNPKGRLEALLKIGQDTTDKHRASEMQATLLAELQHRVRNIMAMMRSMVSRTASSKFDVEDFVQHLQARIDAMGRTQSILSRSPGVPVDLETIIRDELLAQGEEKGMASIRGPKTALSPKAAELITLAIHELATNSVKYGALGLSQGKISISWRKEQRDGQDWLRLSWVEKTTDARAGPRRAGFGTELIEQRVPYELGGESNLTVTGDGVEAVISFPMGAGTSVFQSHVEEAAK